MKDLILYIISGLLILTVACSRSGVDEPEITEEELSEHIDYLASEKMKGRFPGTEGDIKSAEYIRDRLRSYGLTPAVNEGLQAFEIVSRLEAGPDNILEINNNNIESDKFMPFAFSENANISGNIAFAGYGFDISSDTLKWNDYANIDVEGKWVLILRGDPEIDNPVSNFAQVSADRDKVMLAKDKGAAGVLLVSGKKYDSADEFESLAKGEYSTGIPVFRIKRDVADIILAEQNKRITGLEDKLNTGYSPLSFELGCIVNGQSDLEEQKVTTYNVVMTLPGTDPVLKDEYIFIGGHYDHLGMGGPGSSSRAVDTTAIHYGADDNASGVAVVLELAEKFASEGNNPRSIMFGAFGAEEMGLLGSKYLVEHLPVDPEHINAMINLDMIGRLKEDRTIQIGGAGTASGLADIIWKNADTTLLKPVLSQEGYGPSDHSSFYGKDIPVLFFSTGAHLDYHTPYDTPDKINYEGMVNISGLIYGIGKELSGENEKPVFTEAGPKTQTGRGMRGKGVTLGIMPDFAGSIKNGLRADFVTPGRPAALGGMKKGDIIVAINGMPVNNIQDYMFRLSSLEHGQTIQVEVVRADKKELLLIAL